jgi:hypothetical protein
MVWPQNFVWPIKFVLGRSCSQKKRGYFFGIFFTEN